MSRSSAREWIVKLLYQMDINESFSFQEMDKLIMNNKINDYEINFLKKSLNSILIHLFFSNFL